MDGGNRAGVGRVFSQGVRRVDAAERVGRSRSRPRVLVVVQELVQGRAEPRGGILRHGASVESRDGRARGERGRGRGWGRGLPGFAGVSWCGLECACRHRERFRAETLETSPRASCRSGSAESLRGRNLSPDGSTRQWKSKELLPRFFFFWPRDKPTQRCARRGVPPPRRASRRARVEPPVRPRRGVVAPREVRERLAVRRGSSPVPSRRRMFSTQTSPSREKTLATPRLARSPSPRSARPRWR